MCTRKGTAGSNPALSANAGRSPAQAKRPGSSRLSRIFDAAAGDRIPPPATRMTKYGIEAGFSIRRRPLVGGIGPLIPAAAPGPAAFDNDDDHAPQANAFLMSCR